MENSGKMKSLRQRFLVILGIALMASGCFTAAAHAEWHFGIGTGIGLNNIDGTIGFTSLIGKIGSRKYDFNLDPQDFNDYVDTAFGFGGYATDGTWMVQYSFANVTLKDTASRSLPDLNSTAKAEVKFKMTGAELTVGYPVYKTSSFTVTLDGGLRYTKHKLENSLTVTGVVNDSGKNKIDNSWTDAVLGASLIVPFADTWSWNSRANAGFGGSDGTYLVQTGLTWRFHKNWSTSLTGKYVSVDYENGSQGDSDWYYYNADESSLALTLLFNW